MLPLWAIIVIFLLIILACSFCDDAEEPKIEETAKPGNKLPKNQIIINVEPPKFFYSASSSGDSSSVHISHDEKSSKDNNDDGSTYTAIGFGGTRRR